MTSTSRALKTSLISIATDLTLIGIKAALGALTGSLAIVADAWHSFSDLVVSLTVLAGILLRRRVSAPDGSFPPWVRRVESGIAYVVSLLILYVPYEIVTGLRAASTGPLRHAPLAIGGLLVCVGLAWFISRLKLMVGKETDSPALTADGYHSFTDVLSTVAVLLAVMGRLIDVNLDGVVAVGIAALIGLTGVELFVSSVVGLVRGTDLKVFALGDWLKEKVQALSPARAAPTPESPSAEPEPAEPSPPVERKPLRLPAWLPRVALATVVLVLAGGWLSTGLVLVPPGEAGIRLTFGAVGREALPPGLHACLPWPMGSITRVDTAVQRLEVGFRSLPQGNASELLWDALKTGGGALRRPEESLSLTGDEGAADLSLVVHFRPQDPVRYFTRTRNTDQVLRGLVTSEAREVLASLPVEPLLTDSRAQVLARIREGVSAAADRLQLGVTIVGLHCREARPPTETIGAFRDVFAAGEDRLRVRNQAESYQNQALPRARAEQVKRRSEAAGFAHEREARAQGEATRFSLQAGAARQSPKVTALRLHLEAMERGLADKKKIIADPRANRGGYHHWLFAPATQAPAAQPGPAPRPKLLPLPEPSVED